MIRALPFVPVHHLPTFILENTGAVFSAEGPQIASEHQGRPARVLVVEDDYFVATEIEATLMHMGCEVIGIAATGEEAIDLAEREQPELVLMDIRLAGRVDGVEAAAAIYSSLGIRSLFVTAHSDPVTRSRGDKANPLGWASKPFSSHQLIVEVRSALRALRSKQ